MSEAHQENRMGTMPITRLIISMSLPMMASMLVQALYNIVDSIFVSRISEEALTAVSLAFPAQVLLIAVTTGTGVGMNSFLSKTLGEKDFRTVDRIAGSGIFLAIAESAVFLALGIFAVVPFFTAQTDIAEILDGGITYLRICLCLSWGVIFEITFSRLLQSTGRAFFSMVTQLVGAITNIILDPILIFGMFGAPRMGIAGAALATVIGQNIAAFTAIALNLKVNKDIRFSLANIRPDARIIKRIYSVGVPSIVMASIGSFLVFFLNKLLISFSATAAAVLGVYFKLQSFAFMPVFGLNNGLVPIISYNYGARRPRRMISAIQHGAAFAITIMIAASCAFIIFTRELLDLFSASEQMLEIGIPALRTIAIHFPVAGFCICTITTCQALGRGIASLVISFVRQIVVLLPSAYLFAEIWGLPGVWWSFVAAEAASAALCIYMMIKMLRHDIRPLEESD